MREPSENPKAKSKRIETATIGTLLGIVATVIIGVPGIYFAMHEKQPHITYELVGDSKVLDVHQPIKDLEILYRGEDIYAQNKNLRIITLTIRNDGETHIRQADFDESMPWGLQVNHGLLVDAPRVVSENSNYIRDNINVRFTTNNLVTFNKLIFEKEKYFTIELHLLHQADIEPLINVVGKIAGIDNQGVVKRLKNDNIPSVWSAAFSGPFTVQLIRGGVYVIATVITVVSLIILVVSTSEKIHSRRNAKRRREIERYLGPIWLEADEKSQNCAYWLLTESQGKVQILRELKEFLGDNSSLQSLVGASRDKMPDSEIKKIPEIIRTSDIAMRFAGLNDDDEMYRRFLVTKSPFHKHFIEEQDDDTWNVSKSATEILNRLIFHIETTELPSKLKKIL